MKIKIGPYLNWWGPYQIFGLLTKIGVSEDTTHKWANKSPDWFTDFCQWIHDKRKRTVKIKIDKYDVWNMDSTLADIILPMLKLLKENKHGCPYMPVLGQVSNSAQHCFEFYAEEDDLAFKTGFAEWDAIMDEMIWTFEQYTLDDWEDQYSQKTSEFEENGWEKTIYDWKGMDNHRERMQNGLNLFTKYYMNLWD